MTEPPLRGPLPPVASAGSESAPQASEALVRSLLRAQAPEHADRPLVPGPTGWDNAHWVMGDLAVRLPRREQAVPLVANEVRMLRVIGRSLPLAVPVPVHVGEPTAVWPWPWTIVPWFEGTERADLAYPPAEPAGHARALGSFLAALHTTAPTNAPTNPYRGIPLADRAVRTDAALERVEAGGWLTADALHGLREVWGEGLAARRYGRPRVWVHGDLHPGNQLVRDERLVAVVDWGDAAGGDPAVDLAAAWWTLPTEVHAAFRESYGGVEEHDWARGRGWAAAIAAVTLADGTRAGDPAIVGVAHRTVQRLLER